MPELNYVTTYPRVNRVRYPYQVKYDRTPDWWSGHWGELSDWCNRSFGWGSWDYINENFMFTDESHKALFVLRWR